MAVAKPTTSQATREALIDALLADQEALIARVAAGIREALPAYRDVPPEALEPGFRAEVERVLRSARAGDAAVGATEFAELAAVGELRAHQGIPIEDMLRAWRIGVQVIIAHSRELGERTGVGSDELLTFVNSMLEWSDVGMVTTATAHRGAELELTRQDHEHRTNLVRGVLFGTMVPADVRMQAEAHAIDAGREYVAIRARPAAGATHHDLERALGFQAARQHRRGLSALVDRDLAGFLSEPPAGEPPGVVGVGPPRPLDRLAESFRLATRALVTASAFDLSGIHTISTLGLRPAIVEDRDLGEALCQRYLEPLAATSSAAEVTLSLRAYLESGMRVDRAAEQLFVHPNTLRYRLGRFEELTGASLRDPRVALEVWWALERSAVLDRAALENPPKPA